MIDPAEIVEYNGQLMEIQEIPDPGPRYMLGLGHFPEPRRRVIPKDDGTPWLYEADRCPRAGEMVGIWINKDTRLVCPGCGMDGT
jgi:hypothetical protein